MLIAAKPGLYSVVHIVDATAVKSQTNGNIPPAICGLQVSSAWETVATKQVISYVTCPHCRIILRNLKKKKTK